MSEIKYKESKIESRDTYYVPNEIGPWKSNTSLRLHLEHVEARSWKKIDVDAISIYKTNRGRIK